ncbi:hypothetical protein GOBAR_DD05917 [Gossypium barbadense]|nr:hypothetical protein GOBAR_DD05917 [Gossypium barbadense]
MGQQQVNRWRQDTCLSKMSGIQWLQIIGRRETIGRQPGIPLGPMELISKTDGAIAGGSKHFIIHVRMSWQRVLKSRSMLNNLSMMCTPSSARCVSERMSSLSYLTCLHGRCLR